MRCFVILLAGVVCSAANANTERAASDRDLSLQSEKLEELKGISSRQKIVQQETAPQSGGTEQYQVYYFELVPNHIGVIHIDEMVAQPVVTLPFKYTLAYQACSNSRASDNELNNISAIGHTVETEEEKKRQKEESIHKTVEALSQFEKTLSQEVEEKRRLEKKKRRLEKKKRQKEESIHQTVEALSQGVEEKRKKEESLC
jgi:hypothetical protein